MYCNYLVKVSSKIRITQGSIIDEDVIILQKALENLNYLWTQVGPANAADQVVLLGGIGDILEADLEHLHQVSKKITDERSKIKNVTQQALSHSKIEAKLNNKEII
jgi:hypothetical protein